MRYYSNDLPIANLVVHARAPAGGTSASTDAAGHFVLTDVPAAYLVASPDGASAGGNAVSALDAAHVLQFVAGRRTLSAQQALACDVTGDGSLNALDVALLLQYSVGLVTTFPVATACQSDWAFVPVPAAAPNQTLIQPQPGADACTPGGIAYESLPASLDQQSFSAIVFGDCTGNWQPPG